MFVFPRSLTGSEEQKETASSKELRYMPVSLITFTIWRRLELIAENVLPVCMILCDLLPKASDNDLDSSLNKAK